MENPENRNSNINTVHRAILDVCRRCGDKPALIGHGGEGPVYTYARLGEMIGKIAAGLKNKGIRAGDRVGILSSNRPEWGLAYLSIMAAGGVVVPLDASLHENEIVRFFRVSEIKMIFCSRKWYRKAKHIIALDGFEIDLCCLVDYPKADLKLSDLPGEESFIDNNITPDDTAVLIYTSGTTGDPKGVILTHRNLMANLISIHQVLKQPETDIMLSVLPLHHTFEATTGFFHPLYEGQTIVYARALNSRDILQDIKSNNITCMVAVPLLYEKMYNTINRRINELPVLRRTMVKSFYGLSKVSWKMNMKAGKKLFAALREKAGLSSLDLMISGGAPLQPKVSEWFNLLGFTFLQGYGMTECSPVISVNRPDENVFGSVGPPLVGVEVAIDNPSPDGIGEVKVKGDNNTPGYLDNPEATAELLKDGWLYTGDLGKIEEGHLYITGRKKNLIVTGAGKNVYPEEIESELNLSRYINEAIVVGRQPSGKTGEEIWAIVHPDFEMIAEGEGHDSEKISADILRKIIDREIKTINAGLSEYKRIRKFEIRMEPFEKTSTRKIKRNLYK